MAQRVVNKEKNGTLNDIIDNQLCTGCGVCISEDLSKKSSMTWNSNGFLEPKISQESTLDLMQRVCPFNLNRTSIIDEDDLAKLSFENATKQDKDIGLYRQLYVGYSTEYRESSSSGGLATYVFEQLLINKYVEHLFIVREINGVYAYQIFDDHEKIKDISKTRYYPVTLENLFECLYRIEGRVAVSGVACFIKAIRLKQHFHPALKEKIPFLVGIICGGLKSRYYTDYLSQSAGCKNEYSNAEYRVKKKNGIALDYQFSCIGKDSRRIHVIDMQKMGDMWGTGLFKSNACDFCDDVTTELADISLGDAWIKPYNLESAGNSVIVCRSELAQKIIEDGINSGNLKLETLDLELFKSSQQGSFNHRHKGLLVRIKKAERENKKYPIKRSRFLTETTILTKLMQKQRLVTREKSLEIWRETKDSSMFDKLMKKYLMRLNYITLINRKYNRLVYLFKGFLTGRK
ncbi:MAG: Coenzyme F420 hydrogenase/dehydrogenase, beta subunit C-terminal domain [Kluyvera sp.]|uniref:Coenzyme F420 hydrogenase/dehydrogenase, beta subunit C-terminal domain n=1 Tax=Kluyvera sp. TaxID=1538228 RepID=UPI003A8771C5